jgi:leucyl aminopeptidase
MLIMKKDMGGAAAALALGHMIMSAKLDVRLRILIPPPRTASPATPSVPATS